MKSRLRSVDDSTLSLINFHLTESVIDSATMWIG